MYLTHDRTMMGRPLEWVRDDGGRADDYRNDCASRAIAIATGEDYMTVRKRIVGHHFMVGRDANYGTANAYIIGYLKLRGWTLHNVYPERRYLQRDAVPMTGTVVVFLPRHVTVVRDGVVHDLFHPSPCGERLVLGYMTRGET